jgi:hypothetical protein
MFESVCAEEADDDEVKSVGLLNIEASSARYKYLSDATAASTTSVKDACIYATS